MIVQKAKRKQYDDIGNTINRMDEAFLRFPHLPEQIMEKLDFKSLANSRVVAKSWKQFIDEREHRFFKDEIADLKKKCISGETPFHWACIHGQAGLAEIIMKNSAKLDIDLNAKDNCGMTAFHLACWHGHAKTVEIIMENSAKFNIELNAKDNDGWTAFHFVACMNSRTSIVDMLINNSESLKLDLTAKDKYGRNGFKCAQLYRQTDVVNLIRTKMPQIAF